jgi:hypothetical protein
MPLKTLILSAALISATAAHADAKNDFQNFCEQAIRHQLTQPATFKPNYWESTVPEVITLPGQRQPVWLSTVAFTASNAFGAVGSYQAVCSQDKKLRVFAIIKKA